MLNLLGAMGDVGTAITIGSSNDGPSTFAADLPCRAASPDLFFAESPADLERAKALCANCPIRTACLASALERQEPWGVWGGEIFDQGVIIARKRPRGRPRKVAA